MHSMLKNRPFQWVFAFAVCLLLTGYFHAGKRMNGVIWSDQEGYYIYLPALFVHGGFEQLPCVNGCTTVETEDGQMTFTKYTYGVALMEAPFFLAAHITAPLFGHERDGRSAPYVWAILVAAIFYMLAGIGLLSKLLREFNCSNAISVVVPLGIVLGTNLFYYTFREAGMSHVYSFFLFAVLIYASHRRSASGGVGWDILTALPLALIILIRPTNAIAILIPILWGVDMKDVSAKLKKFMTDSRWWLAFAVALVLFLLPQMLYWKAMTGQFLFYSYGDEGFIYWNRPKILQVLLSPQNGWLIYSPIVGMALLGIGWMLKEKVKGALMPVVVLGLATYSFASWWAWWFGGAYGHRCFVDYLPVLALPAAYAVQKIQSAHKWMRIAFGIMAIAAVWVNIRMSYIYQGMWDGPNWGWHSYFEKLSEVFFR